jgi:hypothetical protein
MPMPAPPLQPCWIDNPVTQSYAGQVGIAQSIDSMGRTSTLVSRQRALDAAAGALRHGGEIPQLAAGQASVRLGENTIALTDYVSTSGLSYSLASWHGEPDNRSQCTAVICQMESCNPEWLCEASTAFSNATLGLSYRTAKPSDQ